jgi:hypothetical protein
MPSRHIHHFFNAIDIADLIVLEKMSLGGDDFILHQWIAIVKNQNQFGYSF